MNWFTGFVLYVLIWWTTLFALLPIGINPVADADEKSGWRGAPAKPLLGKKALATTGVAAVIWLGAYLIITSDWFSFRHGVLAAQGHGWFALHE